MLLAAEPKVFQRRRAAPPGRRLLAPEQPARPHRRGAGEHRQQNLAVGRVERLASPGRARNVGRKSIEIMTCSEVVPAAIRPGQRTISGTRIPPSSNSPWRGERPHVGEAIAAVVAGEDDDVLSARPRLSSASSTLPTFWSSAPTISP